MYLPVVEVPLHFFTSSQWCEGLSGTPLRDHSYRSLQRIRGICNELGHMCRNPVSSLGSEHARCVLVGVDNG